MKSNLKYLLLGVIGLIILWPKKVFAKPLNSIYITSPFGPRIHPVTGESQMHNGIDIRAPENTPVFAIAEGIVIKSGYDDINGHFVGIQHKNGYYSGYAHLNQKLVLIGEKVFPGQQIALSGNTGRSSGPHLHLTVKKDGEYVNPKEIIS